MQDMVPYYVKVCYDEKSIAIIFPLKNLVNKYIVTYDSKKLYGFTVHTKRGIIKFRINNKGLYVFKPTFGTANSMLSQPLSKIWWDS